MSDILLDQDEVFLREIVRPVLQSETPGAVPGGSFLPLVEAARNEQPATLTVDEAAQIAGDVAWRLSSLGYGLTAALPGEDAYGGARVDVLTAPDGRLVQILVDVPGGGIPVWELTDQISPGVVPAVLPPPSRDRIPRPSILSPQRVPVGKTLSLYGQPRRWVGLNWLAGWSRYRLGEQASQQTLLDWHMDRGITLIRTAACLSGTDWDGTVYGPTDLTFGPDSADYWTSLELLLDDCAARGLDVLLTILGPGALDLAAFGSAERRLRYLDDLLLRLAPHPHVAIEIAYEPREQGIDETSSATMSSAELVSLADRVRTSDATRLVAIGAEVGERSTWRTGDVPPTQLLTAHPDRTSLMTSDPWRWIELIAQGDYGPWRSSLPALLIQPPLAGPRDGRRLDLQEVSGARYHAFGRLCWLLDLQPGFSSIGTLYAMDLNAYERAIHTLWVLGATPQRLSNRMTRTFRVLADGQGGETPFAKLNGARGIVGRHDDDFGIAIAWGVPDGWTPLPSAGWTATITLTIADTETDQTGVTPRVAIVEVTR